MMVGMLLVFIRPVGATAVPDAVRIPRLVGNVRVDGLLDEPVWQTVAPLSLTMHTPTFGGAPSERTEIRIAHDDAYIYVTCHCFDEPGGAQATSFKRDQLTLSNDAVALILDTFDDNENALIFLTTPAGIRTDIAVFNDGQGSASFNTSWNTFWDVEVTRNEQGWFVEMRIPFSSLRFEDQDGRVVMGLSAFRYTARKNEFDTYPAIEPRWGFFSPFKPSQTKNVVFENVYSRKPLYVTPYLLSGLQQDVALNEAETAYQRHDDLTVDVGVDAKYSLTSNLTLDLTVNTDFAQVEADDQQVNLTRFSLFFPEKRQFFQERSSVFDVNMGGATRLFHSRQIGLHKGQPVRLLGGARLVGRAGAWDVGVLTMQTARNSVLEAASGGLPAENFGVLRLRRQVFNPYSYAGGMATSRIDEDGGYNVTYGLDGIFRLAGDDYLQLNWAQTFTKGADNALARLRTAKLRARWERRVYAGLGYDVSFIRAGADYQPGIGFELRRNYTQLGNRVFYGWLPGEASPLQRHQFALDSQVYLRNGRTEDAVESVEVGSRWEGVLKSGATFRGRATVLYEGLDEAFSLSDAADVPAGRYTFYELGGTYEMPGGNLVRLALTASAGTFYDGRRFSVDAQPTWSVSRYLELSGFYQFNRVVFQDRNQRFNAHVGRLRVQVTLNTKWAVNAFMQYNSAIDASSVNLRVRFNPREGNDFYLVYNEGFNMDRHRGDLVIPLTSARTLVAKYTYTLPF